MCDLRTENGTGHGPEDKNSRQTCPGAKSSKVTLIKPSTTAAAVRFGDGRAIGTWVYNRRFGGIEGGLRVKKEKEIVHFLHIM